MRGSFFREHMEFQLLPSGEAVDGGPHAVAISTTDVTFVEDHLNRPNRAVRFDGVSGTHLAADALITSNHITSDQEGCFEFVIRFPSAYSAIGVFASIGDTNGVYTSLYMSRRSGVLNIAIYNGGSSSGNNHWTIETPASSIDDAAGGPWYHVLFLNRNDGNGPTIALNGVVDRVVTKNTTPDTWIADMTTDDNFRLGDRRFFNDTIYNPCECDISVARYYSQAPTDSECMQIYRSTMGLAGVYDVMSYGLIAHWPMSNNLGRRDVIGNYILAQIDAPNRQAGKVQ